MTSPVRERAAELAAARGYRGALMGAFRKGFLAQRAGVPETKCPYRDRRTSRGGITYSRAFARAWGEGWKTADELGGRV